MPRYFASPVIAKRILFLRAACVAFLAACLSTSTAGAGVWRVEVDRSGDAPTIQAAIELASADASAPIDTVLVGPGRYTWSNQLTGDEHGLVRYWERGPDNVHLVSAEGPEVTILDAQNFGRVFFANGDNSDVDRVEFVIDGFTFTNGVAPSVPNRIEQEGGGMALHLVYPVIRNCIFRGNRAEYGGGVWLGGVAEYLFEDCLFVDNVAESPRSNVLPLGGGLVVLNSYELAVFRRCAFIRNSSDYRGGGAVIFNALVDFEDCVFAENFSTNTSRGTATALYLFDTHQVNLTRVIVRDNDTSTGAAVLIREIVPDDMRVNVNNSIIAFNYPGAGIRVTARATFSCTNIFGHFDGDWIGSLQSQRPLRQNLSEDPGFCEGGSDLRGVRLDSPMLAANNSCNEDIGGVALGCGFRIQRFAAQWLEAGATVSLDVEVPPFGSQGFTLERTVSPDSSVVLMTAWGASGGSTEYLDADAPESGATYRLLDGTGTVAAIAILRSRTTPQGKLAVLGAFPNPFNPQTEIRWSQNTIHPATLRLYDGRGREFLLLFEGIGQPGENQVAWDGLDARGAPAASGVYFVQVEGGGAIARGKLTLIR